MVKNRLVLEKFDKEYIKHKHYSYAKRLKIYDALLEEARCLKKMPLKNSLEGIETCLRISAILNSFK